MKMDDSKIQFADLSDFIRHNLSEEFYPFAYYDKHLDCIRVQVRDCSVMEKRLSSIFTVLKANHNDASEYVGFNIKGVRHLFEQVGLPKSGVIKLAEIIDAIVKIYPDGVVKLISEKFAALLRDNKLEVELNLVESAA